MPDRRVELLGDDQYVIGSDGLTCADDVRGQEANERGHHRISDLLHLMASSAAATTGMANPWTSCSGSRSVSVPSDLIRALTRRLASYR